MVCEARIVQPSGVTQTSTLNDPLRMTMTASGGAELIQEAWSLARTSSLPRGPPLATQDSIQDGCEMCPTKRFGQERGGAGFWKDHRTSGIERAPL